MSQKFVGKMMRMAKLVSEDNNPCYSRKVGVVITDTDSIILGVGYNGPPRHTPHCDSKEYITDILFPKLDEMEKDILYNKTLTLKSERSVEIFNTLNDEAKAKLVAHKLDGCKTCPRRFFGYSAGVRNDLCTCQHAERNAITNASAPVKNGVLFGWCCISCMQCTGAIINARIAEVHFLAGPEYEKGCLKLYEYAGIPVFLHTEEEILNG